MKLAAFFTTFGLVAFCCAQSPSSTSVSPEYTITALPAVSGAPSCLFNCLIPIGLADPSGCDDVTNDCACLSAPVDVLDFLTGCVQTVCKSSTSANEKSATSLYLSYCSSIYGASSLSSAFSANSVSDAMAAASTSMEGMTTSSGVTGTSQETSSTASSTGSSSTASSTAKNGGIILQPSILLSCVYIFGSLLFILML